MPMSERRITNVAAGGAPDRGGGAGPRRDGLHGPTVVAGLHGASTDRDRVATSVDPRGAQCGQSDVRVGSGARRVVDRERRGEPRQIEQPGDLRVLAPRQDEGEAEATPLCVALRTEQGRERRRIDELGVAQVDDDAATLVEQHRELPLEPPRGVRVVLAHQRDDSRWRIPGS